MKIQITLFCLFLTYLVSAQQPSSSYFPDASCQIPTDELELDGTNDSKAVILLEGSFASAFQPGEDIDKSFDGDLNTMYHSPWGNTEFPVVLNYRLNGETPIDYLKYIPRISGNNGDFGYVSIYYNTISDEGFVHLMDYDFRQNGQPTIVEFPEEIIPLNIEITIYDGFGGFASCAEMEFYKKGESNQPEIPEGIFADELCSELVLDVNQSDIDGIDSEFYKSLAQCLLDETYAHSYRVADYEVYWPIQKISDDLKVGGYDPYENATGLVFEEGEKVAIFAKNIPSEANVYLHIKDFLSDGFWGPETFYPLKNGLNVFEVSTYGLGYIRYIDENWDLSDISLNIVSGAVNGKFDLNSDATDWAEVLANDNYPKLDIVGEYAHLVYDKDALSEYGPADGNELLAKYDTIIRYQRMMMGWYKYDIAPKNRMLAYTEEGNGYFAGGPGVHFDLTWGPNNVLNPNQLDLWGIPHEFGHVNQIRPDLNWIGTTEVTNNIYAVWTQYQMNLEGDDYGRLEAENVSIGPGMPSVTGGRINGQINDTYVNGQALQESENYDVFKVLVPFWQLQLYYQKAGASRNAPELNFDYPTDYDGIDYAHWYGTVAELSRNTNSEGLSNGQLLLNFVKNTCAAVEEDLTEFFIHSGFLKPIEVTIDDYGLGDLFITQEMIDQTISEIQSQGYAQPISPVINYMSAHSVMNYKNQIPLSGETGVGVTEGSNSLLIQNDQWNGAVAFETYDDNGELYHVSIVGTGDLSVATTLIYYPQNALGVYAVGFDGERKLVYPVGLEVENHSEKEFLVYPNPFENQLNIPSTETILQLYITDLNGKKVWEGKSNQSDIRLDLQNLDSGVYFLNMVSEKGRMVKRVLKR